MVISTVAKFKNKRQFPLMIVNNTNKTIRLKKELHFGFREQD
jgi:hypothetical protein